tara:strand:+ start:2650 stop:4365 length:1716 start_codon:yes stop_codon:yes gene_type:complete
MAVTSLIELLTNPDAFNVGINYGGDVGLVPNRNLQYGGPSKSIKNKVISTNGIEREVPSYHLINRVDFNYEDPEADPTFNYAGEKSHFGNNTDFLFRGGISANIDRRRIDFKRISNFLYNSPKGAQFLIRQTGLQLLNPQINEKIYNVGANTLLSVVGSGLVNLKRAGLFPKFVGNDSTDGLLSDLLGEIPANPITNDDGYIGLKGAKALLDVNNKYGLGDPGRKTPVDFFSAENLLGGNLNPFEDNEIPYNAQLPAHKRDVVSLQNIVYKRPGEYGSIDETFDQGEDFVPFKFEVINSNNVTHSKIIQFRAYLETLGDNFSATHNNISMNGRGETFYTYKGFMRKVSITFKVAAKSRHEMKPIYQKLNYLAAQTAPNYSKFGRIRTPYMRLTVGDYFKKVPGIVTNVNINWMKEYPWEIRLDPKGLDKQMKILPHVLDVTFNFTPIHDFVPDNQVDTPFIGLNRLDPTEANWIPENEDYSDIDYGEELDFIDVEPEEEEEETLEELGIEEEATNPVDEPTVTYTVKSGDSLSRIASKFGVSRWQDIAEANGISGTIIHPGQVLVIPSTTN